jgi:hypothetical protein
MMNPFQSGHSEARWDSAFGAMGRVEITAESLAARWARDHSLRSWSSPGCGSDRRPTRARIYRE